MMRRRLAAGLALLLLLAGCSTQTQPGETLSGQPNEPHQPVETPGWETTVEDETVENNFEVTRAVRAVDEVNADRGGSELVYYTRMRGETTKTNPYGMEVLVQDGRVVKRGGNNMAIPEEGYILSGNGRAATFIERSLPLGALLQFDRDTYELTVIMDKQAYMTAALSALREIADLLARYRDHNSIAGPAQEKVDAAAALVNIIRNSSDPEEIKTTYEQLLVVCREAYPYVMPSFSEETRAVWHIVDHRTPEEVDAFVAMLADTGFNVILLEAFSKGVAVYPDSQYVGIMPYADHGFDMLEAFCTAGRKYDVEIHVSVCNFFVGERDYYYSGDGTTSPIVEKYPEWVGRVRDGTPHAVGVEDGFVYINQAMPEVRQFLLDVYTEMMERYDIQGINLDYIRYNGHDSVNNAMGFDDFSVDLFFNDTGIDIRTVTDMGSDSWRTFMQWRADQISLFVEALHQKVTQHNADNGKSIRVSACVVGENDGETGLMVKSQDWKRWLRESWLDFLTPMTYYEYAGSVYDESAAICTAFPDNANVVGISPWGAMGRTPLEGLRQITALREAGGMGVAIFYSKNLSPELRELLKEGAFRTKAAPAYRVIDRG